MKKAFLLILAGILVAGMLVMPVYADHITVLLNGEQLYFDVEPVIMNGRTMVPMRAIFEALGCSVSWDDATSQAIGYKNGKKVVVAIGTKTVCNGDVFAEIDQPPVLIQDRTMVPLRFISEAYNCDVAWDEISQTVSITSKDDGIHFLFDASSFPVIGDWSRDGSALIGRKIREELDKAGLPIPEGEDAVATFSVTKPRKYKVWVHARDFATNQQGSRFFNITIDDKKSAATFGKHGKDGFVWEDAGVFDLSAGQHSLRLIDTSAFFARCNGIYITSNLVSEPGDLEKLSKNCPPLPALLDMPVALYPKWTCEPFVAEKTAEIENGKYKIIFYKGQTAFGPVVQNEIYVMDNGNYVQVKGREEEFAYMLQRADSAKYKETVEHEYIAETNFTMNGKSISVATDNMYEMAPVSWCIPTDFHQTDSNSVTVTFENPYTAMESTFAFDAMLEEPSVSLRATFKMPGAYSFIVYNGNGVAYEDFDTVTAPMLFVKHALPKKPLLISESFMFTPMNTLYYVSERNHKGNGKEYTTGLVVDPSVVRQGFSYPHDSEFGTGFFAPDNLIRPHLIAPLMGDHNYFETGESYSFKFRLISSFSHWYNTFSHVAQDMYNVSDIRDNYYTSFNDALYNTNTLWLDDFYGGWDDTAKSYYNMEAKDVTTQSDPLEAAQRYALTDNKTILCERTVPTLAYILSRGTKSFQHTAEKDGLTSAYITTEVPSPIGTPVDYSACVYTGLYEMTQGRMPYFLKYAVEDASANSFSDIAALYRMTEDESYKNMLILKADEYLEKLSTIADANYNGKPFITAAVFADYVPLLNTMLLAYETIKDEKYLLAAEEAGRLLMTSLWSTGYHNGYDFNTYHIEDRKIPYVHDGNEHFFWHGSYKWRVGNPIEENAYKSGLELGILYPTEDVPGWLPAQTGLGTEHPFTPKYGAVNNMNIWAGSILRLARYKNDPLYVAQARNAMIGRFSNYPGYGRERYITHHMYEDYPYKGPDYTGIYYHHIPVFMGMMEDYIINEVLYRSNGRIEFPNLTQQGYAYFDMNRYGHRPGQFYDINDMWLWIDENILTADCQSIDYITARKDGTLGIALLNEKNEPVTAKIILGNKIPNANQITCAATLYDADGNKSEIPVTNGEFFVEIPDKGLSGIVIHNENIKAPSYARSYKYSTSLGQTVSTHKNGKGFVIQLCDELYHAYTYVEDKDLKQLEISYTVGSEKKTEVCTRYPFEFLVMVEDPSEAFIYALKGTRQDGTVVSYDGGTLKTLDASDNVQHDMVLAPEKGTYYSKDGVSVYTREKAKIPYFEPTDMNILKLGRNPAKGIQCWKFVVDAKSFPVAVSEKNVAELDNIGILTTWKHKTLQEEITAASYVVSAVMENDGKDIALYVAPTYKLVATDRNFDNLDYEITLKVFHSSPTDEKVGVVGDRSPIVVEKPVFEPFELQFRGIGRDNETWRYVVPLSAFPFDEITDLRMKDTVITATYKHKTDPSDVRTLRSKIIRVEKRADPEYITLVIPATAEVPIKNPDGSLFDDSQYNVKAYLSMPEEE